MWPNEIFVLVASRTSADALHQHWILNLISVYLMCDLSLFRVLSLEGTGLDCRRASCPVWRDQTQQRQPLWLCTYRSVLWLPFMPVQLCLHTAVDFICMLRNFFELRDEKNGMMSFCDGIKQYTWALCGTLEAPGTTLGNLVSWDF